ncbi:MAG: SpoIIE family protein phosphatase [Acidimicrobiia bacterium]
MTPPTVPAGSGLEVPGLEAVVRFHALGGGALGGRALGGGALGGGAHGGDFYDIVRLGRPGTADGRWAVVLGDVRGDDEETAAVATTARDAIRGEALGQRSPAVMLRSLNELLLGLGGEHGGEDDDGRTPRRCSAVVAVVEPIEGAARVSIAVAGHPAPLVLRRHGAVEVVRAAGPVLGVDEHPALDDTELLLGRGDSLVLYTAGLTGRRGGGRFDEEELRAVLARCTGFTAAVLAERIETAARAFVEDAPTDNLVVAVARVPEEVATATLLTADLPSDATAPGRARRIVTASLAAHGLDDLLEPAVLLASEVVTNAGVHGGGHARIEVEHDLGRVRVSVSDVSDTPPRRLDLGVDATSGRGVMLLDQLAARWGVDVAPHRGKTVWFELDATR